MFEECYSKWILDQIIILKEIALEFIDKGFSYSKIKKNPFNNIFLRKFAFGLAEYNDLSKALFYANGWKDKIGLEIAKAQLKIFQLENGKMPVQREMELISNKIIHKKKYWTKFGINSWNDLLIETFGETNQYYKKYEGENKLEEAKNKLLSFKERNNRIPTARDQGMSVFTNVISRGIWKKFGINTWNDLVSSVFKVENKKQGIWIGEEGLNCAINTLKDYYMKTNTLPKANSTFGGIQKGCSRGYWKYFGIFTWNDLISHVFKNVNKRQRVWTGQGGLENAKDKLIKFKIIEGRKPVKRDAGMSGIEKACRRGYWKNYGISSWKELIDLVF